MTSQEIYDLVVTPMLDGEEMDTDLFLTLLNVGKDILESERPWRYLVTLDSSNSASTSPITLPANFNYETRIFLGTDSEMAPVPFEELHLSSGLYARYTIDHANGLLYVLGGTSGQTLYIYYIKNSPELTLPTSPLFPTRFHKILGFYVVALNESGIDADDLFARMSVENRIQYEALHTAMIRWDSTLQNKSRGDSLHWVGETSPIDLGRM